MTARTILSVAMFVNMLLAWSLLPSAALAQRVVPSMREVTPRGPLDPDEQQTIELFDRAAPSVVYISTKQVVNRNFGPFGSQQQQQDGTGSGFIWDTQGHVVTNYHVIRGASGADVILSDGSVWEAKLVGASPDQDVAVLQIDAPRDKLAPITVGESRTLRVGQRVLAIGNPFGLDQTLTTGIISALGRTITAVSGREITGVIQTDAAINPGNSGGPLLDSAGRLIGVNTAIRSPSGASAGIGFAVPVDVVNQVVTDILIGPPKVFLGISQADAWLEKRLGVERGILIDRITEDSGAARAGLRPTIIREQGRYVRVSRGDVVLAIEGNPISTLLDLRRTLRNFNPGDQVRLTIDRDGEEFEVTVRLSGQPAE